MTKIIDADGHIVEPRTFWQDYIEPRFRDRRSLSRTPIRELESSGCGAGWAFCF